MKLWHLWLMGSALNVGMAWGNPSYQNLSRLDKVGQTLQSILLTWVGVGMGLVFWLRGRNDG